MQILLFFSKELFTSSESRDLFRLADYSVGSLISPSKTETDDVIAHISIDRLPSAPELPRRITFDCGVGVSHLSNSRIDAGVVLAPTSPITGVWILPRVAYERRITSIVPSENTM